MFHIILTAMRNAYVDSIVYKIFRHTLLKYESNSMNSQPLDKTKCKILYSVRKKQCFFTNILISLILPANKESFFLHVAMNNPFVHCNLHLQ